MFEQDIFSFSNKLTAAFPACLNERRCIFKDFRPMPGILEMLLQYSVLELLYPWSFIAPAVLVTQTSCSDAIKKRTLLLIYFSFLHGFFSPFFCCFTLLQILDYSEMFPWTNTEWQQKINICLTYEIQTCTAYTTYIWTEFRLFRDLRRSTCVCVSLRSSVTHLSLDASPLVV